MLIPLKDENPTIRIPVVTVFIIALNSVIFFSQAFSRPGIEYYVLRMGAIPYEIIHGHLAAGFPVARINPFLALITSMFLHGSLFHLAGNMLYLWIFGNNVEDYLGHIRYVFFYLVSGLSAGLTHVIFNPGSAAPMIGASGAIAGVLGAYFILFPRAQVKTFIFLFIFIRVVYVPAAFLLGFWLLIQILNVGMAGGVAWFAHIGGFLVGMVLVGVFRAGGSRRRKPRAAI